MRFKPMPRYEEGAVLSRTRPRRGGVLARLLARAGQSPLGRLLGLMSEKRESLVGRLVYGSDPSAATPVGRMFIQPTVTRQDGASMRLDDVIGNRFAMLAWGADPTHGLTPAARRIWETLGGCFVIVKPAPQMGFRDDVPDGVIAVGDSDGRLKDWFSNLPESVVMLRPDRFVAAMCTPQQVSATLLELGARLALESAAQAQPSGGADTPAAAPASRASLAQA
jgi:3-(3-hydroxy-phenyl)propionate hydroxylase